jgi:cold shock CspA family protein
MRKRLTDDEGGEMMKGIVKTLVSEKKFGFISDAQGTDYFFHKEDFNGFWDDLVKDFRDHHKIEVEFDKEKTERGMRASNVKRTDRGVVV